MEANKKGKNMEKHKKAVTAGAVRFAGLDASAPRGDGGTAYDIKNFKILPDGSLLRRSGFGLLASLEAEIRGLYAHWEADREVILAAAGTRLYRIPTNGGEVTSAEAFGTETGRVIFFRYDGILYLMDGAEVYRYEGNATVRAVRGYVPLYGENWNAYHGRCPIKEPINLLSPKIRVRYTFEDWESDQLLLGLTMKIRSVDRVMLDGYIHKNDYRVIALSDGDYLIKFEESHYITQAEVWVTLEDSYWHDALIRSCGGVVSYDDFSFSRIFLWGGDGGALYASLPVDAAAMAESREYDPDSTALYFPKGCEARLGNGRDVTAVGRVGERMMICSAGGAWITDEMPLLVTVTADKMTLRLLSGTVGCSSPDGFSILDGEAPVTVSAGGIYRWDIDREMERGCRIERLSDGIAPLVEDGFFRGAAAFHVGAEGETRFYLPNGDGRVFIYNVAADLWYCYDGICARLMMDTEGGVVFADGGHLFRFGGGLDHDEMPYGAREIVGRYVSRSMDFGDAEAKKRAIRAFAEADLEGSELSLGLSDGVLLDEVTFSAAKETGSFGALVSTPRFRRLTVTLTLKGSGHPRIYSFGIHSGS